MTQDPGQPPADAEDGSAPSRALLALAAGWWADFAVRVEHAVSDWNVRSAVPARVTFTRQSPREISIAHRRASTELRLEGLRVRITRRRAEPLRHNMGAATLLVFDQGGDGVVALADGQPVSLDEIVERVVEPTFRHAASG